VNPADDEEPKGDAMTEGQSNVSPEEIVKLSAEDRRRMETETQRLREEDEDNARRVEHVKARVRAYLGVGRAQ
jgi:hypothetical protein